MTKSPDTIESEEPDEQGSGESNVAGDASEDEDELALEVEVEPPEPTLEQRLAELEAKQKETFDRYLRSVAELDNFRKRTRKEIEDARIDAQARVLREMLPVIDNLERALAAAGGSDAPTGESGHGIMEGVRLVMRQFAQALERCGVTPVPAMGTAFDPTLQEAVSQMETDDAPPGTVVGVLQTGYRIGERLLRPALVVVAKAPAGRQAPERDEDSGGSGDGGESGGGDESPGPNGHDPDAA